MNDGQGPTSDENVENEAEYFDSIREQLRRWPYTLHQIEDTLDIGLIEGRGKQLLFQAINSKNLQAFAGSGLSMSYGRLSWPQWQAEQTRVVERNAEEFCNLAEYSLELIKILITWTAPQSKMPVNDDDLIRKYIRKSDSKLPKKDRRNIHQWLKARQRTIDFAKRQIARLRDTFVLTMDNNGGFPGGEELPVKFEIAQQLQMQLRLNGKLFLPEPNSCVPLYKETAPSIEDAYLGCLHDKDNDAPLEAIELFINFIRSLSEPIPFKPYESNALKNKDRSVKETRNDHLIRHLESVRISKLWHGPYSEAFKNYEQAFIQYHKSMSRPETQYSFDRLAKSLLVDECPHALILLRHGLLRKYHFDTESLNNEKLVEMENNLKVFESVRLNRDVDGIRKNPDRFKVLNPFRFDNFSRIRETVKNDSLEQNPIGKNQWHFFDTYVSATLNTYLSDREKEENQRSYLTPSSRFLLPVILSRCEDPFEIIHTECEPKAGFKCSYFYQDNPKAADFTSRRSIIADRFDPLAKTQNLFGISQYITTNYDFEIERYFQDSGYRDFPPVDDVDQPDQKASPGDNADHFRHDGLGRKLQDQTFSRERASELVSFTLKQSTDEASVYHLHGRATENDKLVITERDYLSLYLTQDAYRDTVDEGIRIAFAGVPLLFLGLGMNETDLLRPLRQFISNRDRTVGYTSIALLPAEKSHSNRTKFSSALYLRYGIHTIFYGSGQITIGKKAYGIDWLHRIMALKDALKNELKEWTKEEYPPESRDKITIFKAIDEAVGQVGPYLAEGTEGYSKNTRALQILFGQSSAIYEVNPSDNREDSNKIKDAAISDFIHLLLHSRDKTKHQDDYPESYVELNCCEFVPIRPRKSQDQAQHNTGDCAVAGEKYLGFYTGMLDQLLKMTLDIRRLLDGKPTKEERKLALAPMQLALDGLHGAFITASLNAALEQISLEHETWWNNWQQSPPHRIAQIQCTHPMEGEKRDTSTLASGLARKNYEIPFTAGSTFIRHRVDNVITPTKTIDKNSYSAPLLKPQASRANNEPRKLSKANRTGIRAFDTFIAAAATVGESRRSPNSRQIITVAAYRGLGKGTFMSAFTTTLGKTVYHEAVWPSALTGNKVKFLAHVFINLSLSPEIASAYDMLTKVMIDIVAHIRTVISGKVDLNDNKARNNSEYLERDILRLQLDRLPRISGIRLLFTTLSKTIEQHHDSIHLRSLSKYPRVFLCFNSIELLYDEQKKAKNGEIREFLALLFSEELEKCPIDLIFVGDENALGPPWSDPVNDDSEKGFSLRRISLDRKYIPERAKEQIKRRSEHGRIVIDTDTHETDESPAHHIHFARPASPVTIMLHNFRTLSIALYLNKPPESNTASAINGDKIPGQQSGKLTTRKWFDETVIRATQYSDDAIDKLWKADTTPSGEKLAYARDLARNLSFGLDPVEINDTDKESQDNKRALDKCIVELDKALCEQFENSRGLIALGKPKIGPPVKRQTNSTNETVGDESNHRIDNILKHRLKETNRDDAYQWQLIRRWIGGSRFSITILLAAAEHIIVQSKEPSKYAGVAENFIVGTVDTVRNIGQERRDQMVLEAVLDKYREYHLIGSADLDNELHMLIIRHLGIIGTPTDSAVLVRLPEFRKYFKRIGIELPITRRRFLVRAMTTLAYRGLIFRLEPHPVVDIYKDTENNTEQQRDSKEGSQKKYRYALHRIVQSHALSKFQSDTIDPVSINSFAPTLYASMPSTGPRLSRDSYRFLRSLMIGLSQYPDVRKADAAIEPWIFASADPSIKVKALRSALTMARSSFSVAVVSRLAEQTPIGEGVQKRGYFETYRVRLRWIIRMAWENSTPHNSEHMYRPDDDLGHFNALYRDEIVWLYNELGVISLAQGSLVESLGYLRQAAEFNTHIEGPSKNGPIFNYIDLNHAIVQIERGRLESALTRLNRVRAATEHVSEKLYFVATGYKCVLDHIMGNMQNAGARFEDVTSYFQNNREIRAASIFLNHYGRFLAVENPKKASQLIELARDLAETGGHEDIRQQVELARIKIENLDKTDQAANTSNKLLQLRDIEDYGRRMGIWSLQCDSLNYRASILLNQGETSTAGRLLIRSMAIARRNAMALRLNNAMTSYAETLLVRGDLLGAEKIARQSLEKAKSIGYSLETPRAQSILNRVLSHGH